MGKRIISQARGRGSLTYRVRPKAYIYRISYPPLSFNGNAKIARLFNSSAHSSPLVEIEISINEKERRFFFAPAADGIYEGKEIYIGKRPENKASEIGDILFLEEIKPGTKVFNVENFPGSGGKFFRSSGSFGIITGKDDKVEIEAKRRKIIINKKCRAIIGVAAGSGRLIKPLVKAGKQFYRMRAVGRKWHRTSAVKMNAVDHPFGGGRGKRIKSKIAKRNAPPGAKVGHIRPRKTGRKRELKT